MREYGLPLGEYGLVKIPILVVNYQIKVTSRKYRSLYSESCQTKNSNSSDLAYCQNKPW